MTLPLPNGKCQFLDTNGRPLASGRVYHYIPGTSTPKDTWQDSGGITLNQNPIPLDAAGEAVIWGNGSYRQVVLDSAGNQQWDQVTSTADVLGFLPLTGGTMTGTMTVPSERNTGGQLLTVTPYADAVSTLASLNIQGTTTSTTVREYLAAVSLISNKRLGTSGAVSPTTALYTGIQAQAGTDDVWSLRTNMLLDAASGTYDAIAHEIDAVNNNAHRGDTLGAAGLATPVAYGSVVSNAGAFRNTGAYLVTGSAGAHNRGFVVSNNSVVQAAFQDLGNSTISSEIQGSHTYGIDAKAGNFSGAVIRIGNGQVIKSRDIGDTADIPLVTYSGANLVIGDSSMTAALAKANLCPFTDNGWTVGNAGLRWSAIWAVNGTIQTSDPSLKEAITPLANLPPGTVENIVASLSPINFRWKVGGIDKDGGEVPGRRTHWGWDASQIKQAFAATGIDFGGYVEGEDGRKNIRPDQLLPVLWRAVQLLTARVAALEGVHP